LDEPTLHTVLVPSPGSGLGVLVGGVAHDAELGHEEVVAPVVRRRGLLDVGELHKLEEEEEEERIMIYYEIVSDN